MRSLHETWFRLADGTTRHVARDDFRSTYEPGEYLDGLRIEAELPEPFELLTPEALATEGRDATPHPVGA
jgi:hypothetical protein